MINSQQFHIEFTPTLAEKLGFINVSSDFWTHRDNSIDITFDPNYINDIDRTCSMHIDNEDCDTIGSLDFTYLEEFILMLKLCRKHNLANKAEMFLSENSLNMD